MYEYVYLFICSINSIFTNFGSVKTQTNAIGKHIVIIKSSVPKMYYSNLQKYSQADYIEKVKEQLMRMKITLLITALTLKILQDSPNLILCYLFYYFQKYFKANLT